MSTKQVVLLVQLKAREDRIKALKQETLDIIPHVLKEWACIEITLHQNPENSKELMLYELWADKDFLLSETHQKSSYLTTYFQNIEPLLAEPAKMTLWEIVSENSGAYSQTTSK